MTPRPAPVNKWLVTVSVTFGTLMGAIDASIVNVALPHIRGAVDATVEQITWITTGFVIATVIVMPLTAFLGRLFGQKRVYMICLVIFVVGSALCGTARTLPALVAFRIIQGIGAGALQPTEQAILRQTFPLKEQGMAMAVFGMAVMLGPAIGPTLGGYIVDNYGWPWIFYINLPVGALGLLMVSQFVHEDPEVLEANHALAAQQRKHVDWSGIALLSVGLAALQYFLEEGQKNDWFDSRLILACFAVAITSLAAFVIRELTAPVPAVNLRLFKDPVFTSGTLVGSVMFAMLLGNMFLLPIFMQELLGFTATQSGWALMPRVLVMMVATPLVGRIYNLISPRLVIGFGVICFTIGAYQMSLFTLETGQWDIIKSILIQGVGFACLFVPLTTVALSTIPKPKLADATGLNSLLRQIGGSVGLAGFATILSNYAVDARASISAHVFAERPEIWQRLQLLQHGMQGMGLDAVTSRGMAIGAIFGSVARQGMAMAFDKIFFLAGILFLIVLPLLLFLKAPDLNAPKAEVHLDM